MSLSHPFPVLRDTALSYLDDHAMPSGGDWGLGRIAAVFVKGAVNTVIDSCTMERLDGNAIMINGEIQQCFRALHLWHWDPC